VTFWLKNGSGSASVNSTAPSNMNIVNGWTLQKITLTPNGSGQVIVAGTGTIDELRIYPKGSFMNTYSYQPLFGISSTNDINNRPSYYEYDGFGRLRYIRDFARNILKSFEYSSGNTGGLPNWQNTAADISCKRCAINM